MRAPCGVEMPGKDRMETEQLPIINTWRRRAVV